MGQVAIAVAPCYPRPMSTVLLQPGTPCVFVDRKRRKIYDHLAPGRRTNLRGDYIPHDPALGAPDGCRVRSSKGRYYHVFAATLEEHALYMQRHATIVYPKDIATILIRADIGPGQTVVEGGFGSGALSMALLRAIGPTGRLITYELREESINRAAKNVAAFLGETPNHAVRLGDIYDGIPERGIDRIVLDVPEPWNVVPHAAVALRQGGIFAAYVPTVIQVQRLCTALERGSRFVTIDALETLERGWSVKPRSVRPKQSMIGHTGFLVFSRVGAPHQRAVVADQDDPSSHPSA